MRVELRPFRDAMNVALDLSARQCAEVVPRPPPYLVDVTIDREIPVLDGSARRRSCREHRETTLDVLARRYARRRLRRLPSTMETARHNLFAHDRRACRRQTITVRT